MKKTDKKRVVCVTGCRSEYDILYPVMKKLRQEDTFEVLAVACGAHLSERFGYTVDLIAHDGITIADTIHSLLDSDRQIGKIKGSALLMSGLCESLHRLKPDFVMVVGDREEALITGVVCTYLGIPMVHLCGGDRTNPKSGDVDEPVRHATSKLAHLHCTMNNAHRMRLIKMGEEPWRICNSGNPALDRFKEIAPLTKKTILKHFGFSVNDVRKPLVFVLQHVLSGQTARAAEQIQCTMEALLALDVNCVVNYPNSDMGSREIIRQIDLYKKHPRVRVQRTIPRKEFVGLLRTIDLLVGNSSMALLEGGFLRIPAINVGQRNKERMNAGNVIFLPAHTARIKSVAAKILTDPAFRKRLRACRSLYGDGNAAEKIVQFLKNQRYPREKILAKSITY